MNPYQTPAIDIGSLPGSGDFEESERLRRFAGNFYRILGWIAIVTTVVSVATVYWTDYLHIDISFLMWFWLGSSLKAGSPTARRWAIGIFIVISAFCILSFFMPDQKANFGDLKFGRSHPVFIAIVGTIWVVFAIPGIALLGPNGRKAFTRNIAEGEQGVDGKPPEAPQQPR